MIGFRSVKKHPLQILNFIKANLSSVVTASLERKQVDMHNKKINNKNLPTACGQSMSAALWQGAAQSPTGHSSGSGRNMERLD